MRALFSICSVSRTFNLLCSRWWLSRLRFGLLELCWRSLTSSGDAAPAAGSPGHIIRLARSWFDSGRRCGDQSGRLVEAS
jgi:hypothetical protein